MGGSKGGGYGNFGGLYFTPGPLVYRSGEFQVQKTWNEANSWNSKYGLTEGSTYFSFIELGQRFDSRGSSFSTTSGDINNGNPLSYDGYDWRLPTEDEIMIFMGKRFSTIYRPGSTVNGNVGKHYVEIKFSNSIGGGGGYLVFPDNKKITGFEINSMYFDNASYGVYLANMDGLDNYIKQGCVFIPYSGQNRGYCDNGTWGGYGHGYFCGSTQSSTNICILMDSCDGWLSSKSEYKTYSYGAYLCTAAD